MTAAQDRARAREEAVAAAVSVASSFGIEASEPVVLHDLFSVAVHLAPAPVVARVPTWLSRLRTDPHAALAREVDVVRHLHECGAPVVPPSGELPAGPHRHGGHSVTFSTYLEPDPERVPTAEDCVAMLGELHPALATYPGEVPRLDRDAVRLAAWLPRLPEWCADVEGVDSATVQMAADRLAGLLTPTPDDRILHGDAHPGNLLATRNGLLWLDFEDVARGPEAWDFATIGDLPVTPERVAKDLPGFRSLRNLQVLLCLLGLRDAFGDLDGWDDMLRSMATDLATET